MSNQWLNEYYPIIKKIRQQCVEHQLRGAYGGDINLNGIVKMFDGMITEIVRLQQSNDKLKQELQQKQVETLKEPEVQELTPTPKKEVLETHKTIKK